MKTQTTSSCESLFVTVTQTPLRPFVEHVRKATREMRGPLAILRALEEEIYQGQISRKYQRLFLLALDQLTQIEEDLLLYKIPKIVVNQKDDLMTYNQISEEIQNILAKEEKKLPDSFKTELIAKITYPESQVKIKSLELKQVMYNLFLFLLYNHQAKPTYLKLLLKSHNDYFSLEAQTNLKIPDFVFSSLKMPLNQMSVEPNSILYKLQNHIKSLNGHLEIFAALQKGVVAKIFFPIAIPEI